MMNSLPNIDITEFANQYSIPLKRGLRVHALFFVTFLCQVINTALRHGNKAGYWAYMLTLEGPIMLSNVLFMYSCQQLFAQWKYPQLNVASEYSSVLWSYGR